MKKIGAQHKGHDAHKAAEDEADNLAPSLHLCIGARVMLTTDLWTENGLFYSEHHIGIPYFVQFHPHFVLFITGCRI